MNLNKKPFVFIFFIIVLSVGSENKLLSTDSISYLEIEKQYPEDYKKYQDMYARAEQAVDSDSILFYSDEAIAFAKKIGINPARALILRGNGYYLSGKMTLAVECYTQAANLYQEHNNEIGLATAYSYLSGAYISQQNHNNAKLYLNKAIEIFNEENDSVRLASALHNLGFEYYRVKQYDSALILFAEAGKVYQNLNYEAENAYCIGNSGLVYSKLNQLKLAEKNLLQAIGILKEHDDARAVADFSIEYSSVLQRKGNMKSALSNAYKAFNISSLNNITELKRDAAFRLSQIYEQMKRYDSAFHYQLIYYTFSDSIRNLESIQKIADLRTEFEVAQKQTEVDILQKNETLQRIIITGLFVAVLLAAGFIVIIYLNLRRNRRLTKVLEERRKLLEKQSKELMELNRIKDRFFSIISHDLRAPIASLSGISILIKEGLEQNNESLLNKVSDYIDQSVVSLTGLLENLLNWALSQEGKFPYKEDNIDLKDTISEVLKTFASVTLSKNQLVHLKLKPGLVIRADRNSIMTIIRNLLSNALKFTGNGGHITITTQKTQEKSAEIIISDNGIGIPEEKMKDLFKLKEDKSSRGTDNEKGIGLGLSLVQEFVALNKGTIRVESKVGEGTNFILCFPFI